MAVWRAVNRLEMPELALVVHQRALLPGDLVSQTLPSDFWQRFLSFWLFEVHQHDVLNHLGLLQEAIICPFKLFSAGDWQVPHYTQPGKATSGSG